MCEGGWGGDFLKIKNCPPLSLKTFHPSASDCSTPPQLPSSATIHEPVCKNRETPEDLSRPAADTAARHGARRETWVEQTRCRLRYRWCLASHPFHRTRSTAIADMPATPVRRHDDREDLSLRRGHCRTTRHAVRDMGWANALEVAIVSHRGCDRIRTGIVYTDLCLVMHHLKGMAESPF